MNCALFLFGLICILSIPGAESDEIACPRQVNGTVYGKVSFKCYYSLIPRANTLDRKFCCLQGNRPEKCKSTIVSTNDYVAERFVDRISLIDSPSKGYFTVTLSELYEEDTGTYICGIGPGDIGIIGTLRLSVIPADPGVKIPNNAVLVYAMLRGTVFFTCTWKSQGTQRRSLCKVDRTGCTNIIDSTGRTDVRYEGRILATKTALTFTVKIAQLRETDAAYYMCRSEDPEESKDLPIFDLRINEETNIPRGSGLLTPQPGGSLSAQCPYNPEMQYTEKYWCKLEDGVCYPIIKTNGYVMANYEGRVLIHDDATDGLMQVLMNGFTKDDQGVYWCVITDGKNDQTTVVQVRISDDNLPGLSGDKVIQGTTGDTIKITASYPCRLKKAEKYCCRWSNHGCQPLPNVVDTQDTQSASCKTEKLVLTLKSVTPAQSGIYWCGVKQGSKYGETTATRVIVEDPNRGVPKDGKDVSNTDERESFNRDLRKVQVIVTPPSTGNKSSSSITAAVVSVCAAVLVVCGVFLFLRMRKRKNSDLVSVGSYRTNISMSDLDHNIGKENPGVTDLQETDIGPKDSPKTKKKGSREDLDYSSFLINSVENPNEQVA